MSQQRRLAAILFTDIVGSTAIMQKDEQAALSMNKRYAFVLKQSVSTHGGEILNDYGDGSLCAFGSATQAVRCAIEMQQQLQTEPKVPLRIGLHIGEMFFEDGKPFGDGVNVASRIQSLGIANSVLLSAEINNKLKNQPEFKTVSVGQFHFKNVDEPIEVFALSNEGFTVPDKNKLEGKLQEKKTAGRKWILPLAILLLFAISFLIYVNVFHVTRFTEGDKSIAVLPFENTGIRDTEEYISDGITQDIIKNLSKIASLNKVIGWFSVRRFKKTNETLKQVADELGVAAVLSGSLEQHADKIHIIAELTEVNTNKRLWGDDFEYDSRDILSNQSRVVAEIVNALKANVTPQEKNGISKQYTENVDAYKYYLKGRNFWDLRGAVNFDSAEANFREAIRLDPGYALAYAGLADCYTYNHRGMAQLEAVPTAREFADKALALDSNLSEGYTSLGFIQSNFDYEWDKSRKTLERAIELEPNNPTAHFYYGNVLQFTGNTDEGLKEIEKAVELNPLGWAENWVLGRNSYFAGRNDQAIKQFKKGLKIAPTQAEIVAWSLGLAYYEKKMYTEAREQFDKITYTVHNNPIDYYLGVQAYGYALLGDKVKAMDLLKKSLDQKRKEWVSPYILCRVYAALGDYPGALDLLEESYEIRDLHMFYIKVDPGLNPIRNEPRFKEILKKMNLSD
jgi:TolB-like protein/cytochrome c-type biogenesis protein CcmH/NrfG